jgi:hypothetical protein
MFIRILGNLFDLVPSDTRVLVAHVCNNQHRFASGFAGEVVRRLPQVRDHYLANPATLGTVQFVKVNDHRVFANMIAQVLGGDRPLRYNALAKCMDAVAQAVIDRNIAAIYCPPFGAGLARGHWPFIRELIRDCWAGRGIDVNVCVLPQEQEQFVV